MIQFFNKIRSTCIATVAQGVDVSSHSAGCGCEANAGDSIEKKRNRSTCIATVAQSVDEVHTARDAVAKQMQVIQYNKKRQKRNSIKTRINTFWIWVIQWLLPAIHSIKTRKFHKVRLQLLSPAGSSSSRGAPKSFCWNFTSKPRIINWTIGIQLSYNSILKEIEVPK